MKHQQRRKIILNPRTLKKIIVLVLIVTACFGASSQRISLAGEWKFAIDRDDKGIAERWFNRKLIETIILPGSMAERGKGDNVTLQTKWTGSIYDSSFFFRPSLAKYRTPDNLKIPFWLTPAKHYVGRAWYQKEIIIPTDWKGKSARLFLERTHIQTKVWIDGIAIGENNSLSVAHEYELGRLAAENIPLPLLLITVLKT